MKFLFNVILYGFFGYILERIINLIFLGYWLDNRVLFLPIQPMYGLGVALTIVCYDILRKRKISKIKIAIPLMILGILFTWLSESLSGHLHEALFGGYLWDYRMTFTVLCNTPYSCIIPTGIFGIIAALVVMILHPFVKSVLIFIPKPIKWVIIIIVVIDYFFTYKDAIIAWMGAN